MGAATLPRRPGEIRAHRLHGELVLAGEVVVERALTDPGGGHHVARAGRGGPPLPEEISHCLDEAVAGVLLSFGHVDTVPTGMYRRKGARVL